MEWRAIAPPQHDELHMPMAADKRTPTGPASGSASWGVFGLSELRFGRYLEIRRTGGSGRQVRHKRHTGRKCSKAMRQQSEKHSRLMCGVSVAVGDGVAAVADVGDGCDVSLFGRVSCSIEWETQWEAAATGSIQQ